MGKVEAILEVACKLFAEKGYEHTPVSEIAEKAGVAGGTIIYHFKTKDNILRMLAWQVMNNIHAEARECIKGAGSGMEGVQGFVKSFFSFINDNVDLCRVMFKSRPLEKVMDHDREDGPGADIIRMYRQYEHLLESVLEKGIQDGSIKTINVHEAAVSVFSTLVGSAWIFLFFGEKLAPLESGALECILARLRT